MPVIKNENTQEVERPSCSSTSVVYTSELFSFSKSSQIAILSVRTKYSYLTKCFYFTPNTIIENDEDCWDLLYRFRKSDLSSIILEIVKENNKIAFQDGKLEMQNQLKELLFGS